MRQIIHYEKWQKAVAGHSLLWSVNDPFISPIEQYKSVNQEAIRPFIDTLEVFSDVQFRDPNGLDVYVSWTPSAKKLLAPYPDMCMQVRKWLHRIEELVGYCISASVDTFADPYDGQFLLLTLVRSESVTRGVVSAAIDDFCKSALYDELEKSPIQVVFQAEV